jgi:hypothetical protein
MRFTFALIFSVAACGAHSQPHPPVLPKPVCSPIPKSWKLGAKPIAFEEVDKQLSESHGKRGWDAYKKGRRTHDQYREFSDGKNKGILVTRTGCLNSYFMLR